MAHLTIQGGAPKTAKLVYNSNFTRTYGRYIELVNGIINQQTPLGGHHLVSHRSPSAWESSNQVAQHSVKDGLVTVGVAHGHLLAPYWRVVLCVFRSLGGV